jgi:hypothetical protein
VTPGSGTPLQPSLPPLSRRVLPKSAKFAEICESPKKHLPLRNALSGSPVHLPPSLAPSRITSHAQHVSHNHNPHR